MSKRTDEIEAVARKGAAVALTEWSERAQAALRDATRLGELGRRLQ